MNFRPVQDDPDLFSGIAKSCAFLDPDYLKKSAWTEHAPFAFWLVEASRPRILVELGTHYGTSYFAFCQAVAQLRLDTRCFAVDSWEGDAHAGEYGPEVYGAVAAWNRQHHAAFSTLLKGRFDDHVAYFPDGSIDLLHIDGLHTYEAVRHDFDTWRPKLSERGLVLLHDVNVRRDDFGVFRLLDELRADHPVFEFFHGHGLGLVAVGPEQPRAVRDLIGLGAGGRAEAQLVRNLFARLGRACADAQNAATQARTLAGTRAQLRRKEEEAAALAQARDRAQARAADAGAEAETERAAAAAAAAEAQALRTAAAEQKATLAALAVERDAAAATAEARLADLVRVESLLIARAIEADRRAEEREAALRRLETLRDLERSVARRRETGPLGRLLRALREVDARIGLKAWREARDRRLLAASPLFDGAWYRKTYADVAAKGADPIRHYLRHGALEGRRPSAEFDGMEYLRLNPDVRRAGENPLVHYLRFGMRERRRLRDAADAP